MESLTVRAAEVRNLRFVFGNCNAEPLAKSQSQFWCQNLSRSCECTLRTVGSWMPVDLRWTSMLGLMPTAVFDEAQGPLVTGIASWNRVR